MRRDLSSGTPQPQVKHPERNSACDWTVTCALATTTNNTAKNLFIHSSICLSVCLSLLFLGSSGKVRNSQRRLRICVGMQADNWAHHAWFPSVPVKPWCWSVFYFDAAISYYLSNYMQMTPSLLPLEIPFLSDFDAHCTNTLVKGRPVAIIVYAAV